MSESKPVACGCGGIPRHDVDVTTRGDEDRSVRHYLRCCKCGCFIGGNEPSYEELVKKWNTAMSGRNIRFHTVAIEKL